MNQNKGRWPEAAEQRQCLSPAQLEVFKLVGLGWAAKSIGAKLGISYKTANAHIEKIKAKLRLADIEQVRVLAIRWQWDPAYDPSKISQYVEGL